MADGGPRGLQAPMLVLMAQAGGLRLRLRPAGQPEEPPMLRIEPA